MNTIEEILKDDNVGSRIQKLKQGRMSPIPDIPKYKLEWNPYTHKSMVDRRILPNRKVKKPMVDANGSPIVDKDGKQKYYTVEQSVNRVAFPFQKKIVNTAVAFAFGNPVALHAETQKNTPEDLVYQAIKKLNTECKLKSFNRRMYRELLRATEVAEMWHTISYPDGQSHSPLGFPSKWKVRVSLFSPWKGDILYPYFDFTGDLIAFSREFCLQANGKSVTYFETYTDKKYYRWIQDGSGWREDGKPIDLKWGKMPIVYGSQEAVEWIDVQIAIERLEFLLSKFGETNDYHASPTVFVQGGIKSMPEKGESGKVLEGNLGADAKYLSWDNAPEAVKLEIETLLRFIYGFTQTPDVSFDSVKGLHQISGEALRLLFMDAHLKVEEKKEIFDDYLQRRVNIQKAIIGELADLQQVAANLEIEPEVVPFILDDHTTLINNLSTATGGKPIISQKTAVRMAGFIEDIDAEMDQLEKESEQERSFNLFEPTNG